MHTHIPDTDPTRTSYLRRVATAIAELDHQRADATAMPHRSDVEHAARAARLALICARTSAWWGLLARETYRDHDTHALHGRTALIAQHAAKDNARFWRDAAADWTARAEHRPTSDAAGALSNWHELEVTTRDVLWHLDAACTGMDPEVFYPLDLTAGSGGVTAAKEVCAGCPVRTECLADVMAAEDPARRWGVSGGTTPAERAALFAAQHRSTARPEVVAA